jgi:type I restriction enzyme S subunit
MTLGKLAHLPDVAEIVMGQSPPGDTYNEMGDGLPFFQGKAEFGEVSPIARKWCNAPKKIAEAGDILMSVRAPVGPTNLANEKCCIGRGLAAIRANPDVLDPTYLRFALRHAEPRLASMGQGSTFAAIGRAELATTQFPLPPLPQQRRIVDLLSRAEGIVRLRREAEKKAAELIPALFLGMFGDPATNPKGWPMATVGSVLDAVDYGSSSKATSDGAGLPMIRMGNVTYAGNLDLADLKYVDLPAAEAERYALHEGDILFNRTNSKELVGKTGLWDGSCEAIVASYFIRLRVQSEVVNPHYLWAFMNSAHMKRVIFDTARGAIGQSNINSKELKAFPLPVPPLPLQEQFALHCADVSEMVAQQSAATSKAKATFDALLAQTFS